MTINIALKNDFFSFEPLMEAHQGYEGIFRNVTSKSYRSLNHTDWSQSMFSGLGRRSLADLWLKEPFLSGFQYRGSW